LLFSTISNPEMKALVLQDYKRFSYEEAPAPSPAADEALVRVKACGICGSDVHGMDGSTGRRRPPIIMGHEASGVIAELGSGASEWAKGDRVTFDSTIYCGQCGFCRRGEINLCDQRRVLGVSCADYRRDGAFAEFLVVPERVLYRIPEGLSFEHAALIEPFAIALHAIKRPDKKRFESAVVIGAGMIGLALVQVLASWRCPKIICVDLAPDRLALASKCGATHVLNSQSVEPVAEVLGVTGGVGTEVSFEAVGVTSTVDLAVRSVRKGGAVVLVGNVSPKIEFPLQAAVTRELSIYGSCASKGDYPECLDLMARKALQPDLLISAVAPLSEGSDWFQRLYSKEPGLLKVVLKP
jgi:L-iditol 2-dehydrogenase